LPSQSAQNIIKVTRSNKGGLMKDKLISQYNNFKEWHIKNRPDIKFHIRNHDIFYAYVFREPFTKTTDLKKEFEVKNAHIHEIFHKVREAFQCYLQDVVGETFEVCSMFNYRAPKYIRKAVEKYDQESI
jgi:hypothetical protein